MDPMPIPALASVPSAPKDECEGRTEGESEEPGSSIVVFVVVVFEVRSGRASVRLTSRKRSMTWTTPVEVR